MRRALRHALARLARLADGGSYTSVGCLERRTKLRLLHRAPHTRRQRTRPWTRRPARLFGTVLVVGGLGCLAWAFVVWRWEDPFTGLYTEYRQAKLERRYEALARAYGNGHGEAPSVAARAAELRGLARRGDPIARIRVPAIGLNMLVVNGTDSASLKAGPGRYAGSAQDLGDYVGEAPPAFMPGEGELVYLAGHRTTYAAPFARINEIEKGDRIDLELPYASVEYIVTGWRIVVPSEISVLRSRGYEQIALQACHPRFRASQRYIVYGKAVRVAAAPATGAHAAGTV